MSKKVISSINLIDCSSMFKVIENLRPYIKEPKINYDKIVDAIKLERANLEFSDTEKTLALAVVDSNSMGQLKFVSALESKDILVEKIELRNATTLEIRDGKRFTTVSTNLAYILGMFTARKSPNIVVVSNSFDLFSVMKDSTENRGCKIALAFFRRFLDNKFLDTDIFSPDSAVKFIDLDKYSESILNYSFEHINKSYQGISAI